MPQSKKDESAALADMLAEFKKKGGTVKKGSPGSGLVRSVSGTLVSVRNAVINGKKRGVLLEVQQSPQDGGDIIKILASQALLQGIQVERKYKFSVEAGQPGGGKLLRMAPYKLTQRPVLQKTAPPEKKQSPAVS